MSLSAAGAFLATAGSVQAAPAALGRDAATLAVTAASPAPQGARRIGPQAASRVLHLDVVLQPRDPAALSRYATEVATPGSSLYHDYLPKGAFASVFGPTGATIAEVSASLRDLGLHPGKVSSSHLSIPVTATAGAVESAFRTTLTSYRLASGRTGFTNTSAVRLPAAIAPQVQAVFGLDSLTQLQPLLVKPSKADGPRSKSKMVPQDATGGPQPCQSALNEQSALNTAGTYVLTADQMAYDYEYSPLYLEGDFGNGQTVAIVELGESDSSQDIADYESCYGVSTPVSYENIDGFKNSGAGEGEAALDIETIAVMAPGVNIVVYRGPNSGNGWYDTFATVADQDIARTESVSYGLCEAAFNKSLALAINTVYEQEAVQGQTVLVSSGDTGSEGCLRVAPKDKSLLSAEFPSTSPWVLAVGGTSIVSDNPEPRNLEVVWNDGYDGNGAGGGGISTFFKGEPSYQKSFGIKASDREVPDVSANADLETGYLIVYKGAWLQVGGTSAAAPMWAAMMALTDNRCPSSPAGFVNPTMYYVAGPKDPNVTLNDIQAFPSQYPNNTDNDYTGDAKDNDYPVLVGYDMATGLGSPVGGQLATDLCKYSAQGGGYRIATAQGAVYSFNAPNYGSLTGKKLNSKVTGIADDPNGNGYWLVTAKGSVSGFNAATHGSAKNVSSAVVGIAAASSGKGYWLVTAKGHVYAFGVPSHGSVTGSLASPVVGIAADPFTGGYWVVTQKGKVYAFDAGNYKGKTLSKVTAIAADPKQQGYWLLTSAGVVYGFNVNVPKPGGNPVGNAFGNLTGIAGDGATGGFWLATSTGLVAGLDATVHGSHPVGSKNPVVGIASTH